MQENLLNFHLSYLSIKNFSFEPNENTKKIIWQYLSSNNLLTKVNDIDLEDREKIKSFEKLRYYNYFSTDHKEGNAVYNLCSKYLDLSSLKNLFSLEGFYIQI